MATGQTTINIQQPIEPPRPLVVDSRQIKQGAIKKILRDLKSKSEMVLRDCKVKGIADSSISIRRNYLAIHIVSTDQSRPALSSTFAKQIKDNDNSFKELRLALDSIETQYRSLLTQYGLDYSDYNDPFINLRTTLTEESIAENIWRQKKSVIENICSEYRDGINSRVIQQEALIQARVIELNTTDPYNRRSRRVNILAQYGEQLLQELILYREEFKKKVQDAYQELQTLKFTKSAETYESHGPTAIL